MKLKEVLDKTSTFFREKGFPTARLDTELLLAHGLRMERIGLYLQFDRPLKEEELNQCRELVKRRARVYRTSIRALHFKGLRQRVIASFQ